MMGNRLKFYGWGFENTGLADDEREHLFHFVADRLGVKPRVAPPPPRVADIALSAPRVAPPAALARVLTQEPYERLLHTYGKSYPETVRAFARDFANAPDLVALPESEADVAAVLDWGSGAKVAVIPFGGGSSVVGGVEPAVGGGYAGAVSLDLRRLDRVLEVDATSRAARIESGIRGPAIEAALKPHGLAIRHYPQSFEFSTLGGWIATRSGGHFATLYTHIDDFVESIRTLTPAGVMEFAPAARLGAGPSPDRLIIGSEGALGVITEAWMRLQGRPRFRGDAVFGFPDFFAAARAVRAVAQAGLYPSNLRVIDNDEAGTYGVNAYEESLLVLAFEFRRPSGRRVDGPGRRAPAGSRRAADTPTRARACAGARPSSACPTRANSPCRWASSATPSRARSPGISSRLFMRAFARRPRRRSRKRPEIAERSRPASLTSIRTVRRSITRSASRARPRLIEQWRHIKTRASDALIAAGGTITHHHAVGRDHMAWYRAQRPALFGRVFEAAKRTLDPAGIMKSPRSDTMSDRKRRTQPRLGR